MKKLLVTTLVAATVATGFVGQAEAADKQIKVYTKVIPIQLEQLNQEKMQSWIEQIYQTYQLPMQQPSEKPVVKQPAPTKKPAPVKEVSPAPTQKPAPVKEVSPAPTQKPAPVKEVSPAPTQKPAPVKEVSPAPTKKPAPVEEQANNSGQQTGGVTQEEQQMIDMVNQERSKQGLAPLKANLELTKVARVKAQDMINNNYFSHQSPTYGSPFDMLTKFGVEYRTAGGNLAGNQTVEAAHQALMNSEGHRANILNANYQEVGIGIIDGGPYGKMFVQLFKG